MASLAAPLVSDVSILFSVLKAAAAGQTHLTVKILPVTKDAMFLSLFCSSINFQI